MQWRKVVAMVAVPFGMLFALSTWFLTNAVASGLEQATCISSATVLQLTNAVQAGFIVATVLLAATGLADRVPSHLLFGASAVCAGAINALVLVDGLSLAGLAIIRLMTGAFLAGVYPIGMKLLFAAVPDNRGLALGLAVGALTMGSGLPHLLAANFASNWKAVVVTSSALAVGSGMGISLLISLSGGEIRETTAPKVTENMAAHLKATDSATGAAFPSGTAVEFGVELTVLESKGKGRSSHSPPNTARPTDSRVQTEVTIGRDGEQQVSTVSPLSGAAAMGSSIPRPASPPLAMGAVIKPPSAEDTEKIAPHKPRSPHAGPSLYSALFLWTHVPSRLAFIGYLGHVAELYAAWTVFSPFLQDRFSADLDPSDVAGRDRARALASVITFAAFAAGAVLCPVAGIVADNYLGRTLTTSILMVLSGSTALWLGFATDTSLIAFGVVFYGATIVPDSAQFSTAIGELAPPDQRGAMLSASTGLGFAMTMITIATTTAIQAAAGWGVAFALLAIGPAVGTVSMLLLRARPEATAMANGRR